MPTVARVIADQLKVCGVDHFFCVTGGDQPLWIALDDVGITIVPCRSEHAAAYAADGYARLTGRPAFVYGQFGPGVASVASGLADAYWAMSPVVSLTSSTRTRSRYRFEYQELDQVPMHAPVTKWAATVPRPDRAAELARAAIRQAVGVPPGPVHLELPADMLGEEVGDQAVYRLPAFAQIPGPRVGADPSTLAGEGAIAETHDLALGVVGRYSRKVANDILAEADLVLAVGTRLGGLATDGWRKPSARARIIHIDADPAVLGATYREEVSILADARLGLAALTAEIRGRGDGGRGDGGGPGTWAKRAGERVQAWRGEVAKAQASSRPGARHPAAVIAAVRDALEPADILVADTGYMGAWTGALFEVTEAGRHYLRAAGSLGWAFPASIGASLAAPDATVLCVSGDGGIGYHLMELRRRRRRRRGRRHPGDAARAARARAGQGDQRARPVPGGRPGGQGGACAGERVRADGAACCLARSWP
ncbi:MAG TPA: thiamine pyrophosphate-binding protein [Streptosporangiaceae bacterium]|nr:thiamine pyrophosphate-binding protein [Streptosporangiaceae bacterium]